MRLFEAILDANHRALAGDNSAGVRPGEFEDQLPVVALSCIDPRLNPLLPEVLGIPEEQFIWLRNAGNIITGPLSSTLRSLALACAVKGGRQITIIGHTDCRIGKTTMLQLVEQFRRSGVSREALPQNPTEFFGLFASEQQNVLRAVQIVRSSPLIGQHIPVHGLMLETDSGRLHWLVNGYEYLPSAGSTARVDEAGGPASHLQVEALAVSGIQFPEQKIGDLVTKVEDWLERIEAGVASTHSTPSDASAPPEPPKIPLPPQIKPRIVLRRSTPGK